MYETRSFKLTSAILKVDVVGDANVTSYETNVLTSRVLFVFSPVPRDGVIDKTCQYM